MKSKEEIKLMGEKYATTHKDVSDRLGKYLVSACFQDGYIQCQCQEDMADKKYTEEDIREAIDMARMLSHVSCLEDGEHRLKYSNTEEDIINSLNKQD